MSQVSKPDIPDERYNELVNFITGEVRKGSIESGGLYHRKLSDAYLDRYLDKTRLDDPVYTRKENKVLGKLLRWLLEVWSTESNGILHSNVGVGKDVGAGSAAWRWNWVRDASRCRSWG